MSRHISAILILYIMMIYIEIMQTPWKLLT